MAIDGSEPSPGAIVPCLVVADVPRQGRAACARGRSRILGARFAILNGTTCIFRFGYRPPTCSGVIDTVSCKIHSDTCGRSLRFGRYSNQNKPPPGSTRRL